MKNKAVHRPDVLESAPLHYAPENEAGVVYLFSHIAAKKLRLRVDLIRDGYPDCIAYQKVGGKEKKIRIEFEFESKNFDKHGHDPKVCDWIVCWAHNWPDIPKNLHVIELRTFYGKGFNIWIMPVGGEYKKILSDSNKAIWSVPSLANKGDLLLYYHTSPDKCIKDIFRLISPVQKGPAGWKSGNDYFGDIRRICTLKAPIFFEDLKNHKILKTAGFIRGQMQGRPKATEFWPHLYDLIVNKNPSLKKSLSKYSPDKL